MARMRIRSSSLLPALIISSLIGCGGGGGGSSTATLSVAVTDAPVDDATHVVVRFTGVEVQGRGERLRFDLEPARDVEDRKSTRLNSSHRQ